MLATGRFRNLREHERCLCSPAGPPYKLSYMRVSCLAARCSNCLLSRLGQGSDTSQQCIPDDIMVHASSPEILKVLVWFGCIEHGGLKNCRDVFSHSIACSSWWAFPGACEQAWFSRSDKSRELNLNAMRYLRLCSALLAKEGCVGGFPSWLLCVVLWGAWESWGVVVVLKYPHQALSMTALGMNICQSTWQGIGDLRPSITQCNADGPPGLRN